MPSDPQSCICQNGARVTCPVHGAEINRMLVVTEERHRAAGYGDGPTAADKLRELLATRPEMPNTEELFRWWQTSGELLDELLNPAAAETPLDELAASLVVALHAMANFTGSRSLAEVRELASKAHGLAIVLDDTRRRMLALERRSRRG